jgi:hypothetical protein
MNGINIPRRRGRRPANARVGHYRRALFEQLDKSALGSLPPLPYEYSEWKRCRVGLDYHVEIAQRAPAAAPGAIVSTISFTPGSVQDLIGCPGCPTVDN